MESKNIDLSVIIPVYNEEENVEELYRRLRAVLLKSAKIYEIIFVDDGSKDKTPLILRELHAKDDAVKILQFARNLGQHIAFSAGLDFASGDIVLTMDGDLQDRPEDIPKLLDKMGEGYDMVCGKRMSRKDPLFRKIISRVFYFLMRRLVDEETEIDTIVFRAMARRVVENLRQCQERNRYVIGLINWLGFPQAFVWVPHEARFRGKSKYTIGKLFRLALDATFSFSNRLLKIASVIGFFISAIAFLMGLYFVWDMTAHGSSASGYFSIILAVFFLGGIQLIILGIVGEYVGRIYIETKGRPLYIIKEKIW
ncbi:MAG: glycosyltransferase family 2 protein [Candidatus Nealsonbacteria bacterium]|nr:glycosyltransferase family 2 protein [Candidatus Nealsonbacteria bacterium]